MKSTGTFSLVELQSLDYTTGYQDSKPNNDNQAPCPMDWLNTIRQATKTVYATMTTRHHAPWTDWILYDRLPRQYMQQWPPGTMPHGLIEYYTTGYQDSICNNDHQAPCPMDWLNTIPQGTKIVIVTMTTRRHAPWTDWILHHRVPR